MAIPLKILKEGRLVCVLLIITTSFYFVSYGVKSNSISEPSIQCSVPEKSTEKQYVSSLCNCAKIIPVANEDALNKSAKFRWCSVESDLRGDHQRVVTYTLYGDANNASTFRRYYSLMRNLSLTVQKEYPGWAIRFYHSFTDSDREAYGSLCDIYCQFPHVDLCSVTDLWRRIGNSMSPIDPALLRGLNQKIYRFLVMLDPQVDVFISRDVDSLIFKREVDAVEQWLQSNYTFHLMRDHVAHRSIILAGMWGAKMYQRRDLIEGLARAIIMAGQDQIRFRDQAALDTILWPVAKFDVMAHDSYHCETDVITRTSPLKVFPFPTKRNGSYYIGGAGHELYPVKCPVACRPPGHQDWEYC